MTDARTALVACRAIVRDFVDARTDYGAFRQRMATAMEPLDPLDWVLDELPKELQTEVRMYSEWLGGEFGEASDRIATRRDWVYGECHVPYGWVDVDAYRERLRAAFRGILSDST